MDNFRCRSCGIKWSYFVNSNVACNDNSRPYGAHNFDFMSPVNNSKSQKRTMGPRKLRKDGLYFSKSKFLHGVTDLCIYAESN
jgi:hypothetical protein